MTTEYYSHAKFLRDNSNKDFHPSFTINISSTSLVLDRRSLSFWIFRTPWRIIEVRHAKIQVILNFALSFRSYKHSFKSNIDESSITFVRNRQQPILSSLIFEKIRMNCILSI